MKTLDLLEKLAETPCSAMNGVIQTSDHHLKEFFLKNNSLALRETLSSQIYWADCEEVVMLNG